MVRKEFELWLLDEYFFLIIVMVHNYYKGLDHLTHLEVFCNFFFFLMMNTAEE